MGKIPARCLGPERIKDATGKTLMAARARGGDVQSLAETRLAEPYAALETNEHELNEARAREDAARAALLARDEESDLEIGMIADESWNALGRPAQSVDYDVIFAGGTKTWTGGDPATQPHGMGVLANNIRSTNHPKLIGRKEEWAQRIEKRAAAQMEAAMAAAPLYARMTALASQRRTLADLAQLALSRYKRDLKNLGMSEAQIHEIIPDASSNGSSAAAAAPAAGSSTK